MHARTLGVCTCGQALHERADNGAARNHAVGEDTAADGDRHAWAALFRPYSCYCGGGLVSLRR